jgi:hypothetical protein
MDLEDPPTYEEPESKQSPANRNSRVSGIKCEIQKSNLLDEVMLQTPEKKRKKGRPPSSKLVRRLSESSIRIDSETTRDAK